MKRILYNLFKAGVTLLSSFVISFCILVPAYSAQVVDVRVWPSEDYTRVTVEHKGNIRSTHFTISDPERLVIDIEGVDLNPSLKEIVSKIRPDDPYIKKVRVGQLRSKVVRFVFDLKEVVKPQVFTLTPQDKYQHRLVVDLYPNEPHDPIAALIKKGDWDNDKLSNTVASNTDLKPEVKKVIATPHKPQEINSRLAKNTHKMQLNRMVTIVLDPGHGGEDPGALGRGGSKEKDVVLAIAKRLKTKIEQEPNMRVVMTRNGDYFIPLHVRVQKARQAQADLFISIHADAFVEPTARGASVFALSEKGASSTAARWLARKENAADLIGGVNIKNQNRQLAGVLLDLSTTAQIKDSMQLGSAVLGEIGNINPLHKGSVEQAGFAVLKAPDVPSILVETAFISNPEEEAKLNSDPYQDSVADAILNGMKKYFSKNPPQPRNQMM